MRKFESFVQPGHFWRLRRANTTPGRHHRPWCTLALSAAPRRRQRTAFRNFLGFPDKVLLGCEAESSLHMRPVSVACVAFLLFMFARVLLGNIRVPPAVFPWGACASGPLIFTILDAEWHDQLGEPPNVRTPQQRFLSIRISVTNSGVATSGIPALSLVDSGNNL